MTSMVKSSFVNICDISFYTWIKFGDFETFEYFKDLENLEISFF